MQSAKRYLLIVGIAVPVLLIVGFILAALFNVLLNVLYITLIILAAFTLVAVALLIYAVLMLINTITTVRNEVNPLLASMQETVGILKNTARTAGQTVATVGSTAQLTREFAVKPSVQAAATLMAGQRVMRVFLGKGNSRRAEERRRQQMDAIYEGE